MRQFQEDRRKLKELILYISQDYESDPNYGSTHLNKLLFFADFLSYAKYGRPITGAEYVRERHGPVPSAVRLGYNSPVQELVREGRARINTTTIAIPGTRKTGKRITPVAVRPPDMSVFSEQELELINAVLGSFRDLTAGWISKYTHEFAGWHVVALNEKIPYETIFVSPDQRQSEHIQRRGLELAREHGWLAGKS